VYYFYFCFFAFATRSVEIPNRAVLRMIVVTGRSNFLAIVWSGVFAFTSAIKFAIVHKSRLNNVIDVPPETGPRPIKSIRWCTPRHQFPGAVADLPIAASPSTVDQLYLQHYEPPMVAGEAGSLNVRGKVEAAIFSRADRSSLGAFRGTAVPGP
jgi:hypothetical protein